MPLQALSVALGQGETRRQLPAEVERDYLGGRGAVAWTLFTQLPPHTPPLAPENLLVFAAGPLAGTAAFATGGFVVGARSPITGGIAYGWAQGHWGAALRRAGYDVLIISGQAADWSVLVIDGQRVELRPAAHLLGHDTRATAAMLADELGADFRLVCLGPAGETEVAYSSIVAEGRYMTEPAGTGVVMATKRLKAIAVRDGDPLPARDEQRLGVAGQVLRRRIDRSPLAEQIRQLGSLHFLDRAAEWGALTGRNGQTADPGLDPVALRTTLVGRGRTIERGCAGCPLPCYFDHARQFSDTLPRPELEIVAGFAARCGITSPDALFAIADRCLRLGLDPAAAAAAVAFLMECQQAGLSRSGTLNWGDDEAVLAALDRLGQPHDKRDVLSLGVGEMQEIFWGSAAFAPHVKHLAMPALDPRALTEVALAMTTAPIGGDFRYAMTYEELVAEAPAWLPDEPSHPQAVKGKVLRLIWHERFAALLDAAGICRRLGLMAYQVSPGELIAMIAAATGRVVDPAQLTRIGERIVTIERLFAREQCDDGGLDQLPDRWRETPLSAGRAARHLPPLGDLRAEYYRRHGWSAAGDPLPERLAELGIAQ